MPLQQIIGPNYVVARAGLGPAYAQRPYLRNLILARITASPQDMRLEEVVVALRRRFS
jgi:hypothetical protein